MSRPSPDAADRFLGRAVACLRASRSFSRARLAEAVSVSQQQVAKYETGADRLSLGRAVVVCLALRCTICDLLEEAAGLARLEGAPDHLIFSKVARLSSTEHRLLELIRRLEEDDLALVRDLAERLVAGRDRS